MENLIFDRTQNDLEESTSKGYYNYTDLNRVEEWCEYLANLLTSYSYPVSIVIKKDWSMQDLPNTEDMERIRKNIGGLKTAFYAYTEIPENLNYMTIEKANSIEKILNEIDKILEAFENDFIYCGVASSSQNSRVWQQKFRRPKTWISQPYKLSQYAKTDKLIMIATDNGVIYKPSTKILGFITLDKRNDVFASIKAINESMKIIEELCGDV